MKEKAARFVVKKRIAILIVAVALLIPSAIGFVKTFVNYDILTYLPADLDSMIGQNMLEDDFHMASSQKIEESGRDAVACRSQSFGMELHTPYRIFVYCEKEEKTDQRQIDHQRCRSKFCTYRRQCRQI